MRLRKDRSRRPISTLLNRLKMHIDREKGEA
jgi:hypothetical protein